MTQFELGKIYLRQRTSENGHHVTCLYDDGIKEARFMCSDCRSGFTMLIQSDGNVVRGTPKSCHEIIKLYETIET